MSYRLIMNDIIWVQYRVVEYFFEFIQSKHFIFWDFLSQHSVFFEYDLTMFLWSVLVSILSWLIWRWVCSIIKTTVYNIQDLKWILLLNIFFIVPFLYWALGWQFKFRNFILMLAGNWIFFYLYLNL